MIFAPALRPFLERRPDALNVLVLEPQTMWLADDPFSGPFREFRAGVDLFASLPGHKLVHSVGMPLGGTRAPDGAQCALVRATADRLDSPWVSEHLSVAGTPDRAAGFLLPPLQTDEGAAVAVANVSAFAAAMARPVAVETGTAYLTRKSFEMEDGVFLAEVVETANCGILLDLHNLYCNARNGRIRLDTYLRQIPLDRVWEVHLAGGDSREGFWLDSHSGAMPPELKAVARDILSGLPNLGALNFEIYGTYLERIAPGELDRIVDGLHAIWADAGRARGNGTVPVRSPASGAPAPSPEAWEAALTAAVWLGEPERHPWLEDAAAIRLYSWLARSFRGSMLARTLPRAIRYLLLRDGEQTDALLHDYFRAVPPQLYAPLEAAAFSDWLGPAIDDDVLLAALFRYDRAILSVIRNGVSEVVAFPGNPLPVFEALADFRLPQLPDPPPWELELLPDDLTLAVFDARAAAN